MGSQRTVQCNWMCDESMSFSSARAPAWEHRIARSHATARSKGCRTGRLRIRVEAVGEVAQLGLSAAETEVPYRGSSPGRTQRWGPSVSRPGTNGQTELVPSTCCACHFRSGRRTPPNGMTKTHSRCFTEPGSTIGERWSVSPSSSASRRRAASFMVASHPWSRCATSAARRARVCLGSRSTRQKSPTVLPSASMSTFSAAGVLPSPGICVMSPHSGTSQPAPV